MTDSELARKATELLVRRGFTDQASGDKLNNLECTKEIGGLRCIVWARLWDDGREASIRVDLDDGGYDGEQLVVAATASLDVMMEAVDVAEATAASILGLKAR